MNIQPSKPLHLLLSSLLLGLALPAMAALSAPFGTGLAKVVKTVAPTTTTTPPAVVGSIDPVNGYLSISGSLKRSWVSQSGGLVQSNNLLTVSSATMNVAGVTRRYLSMRPTAPTANLPMLLLLHASGVTPEAMASLTEVADYAATQGFWVVLPAAVGGVWKDDPLKTGSDDVNFITALITQLGGQGADPARIYAAGYSNGGFMATRLACAASDRIAAFAVVAATTRYGVSSTCGTPLSRPKVWFVGTADTIVPIAGALDLRSADSTLAFWNSRQGCAGVLASSLPNRSTTDGTTVQLTRYTGCSGSAPGGTAVENQVYTVTGGGHAWPGGLVSTTGVISQDIKATGLIWNFVRSYRR
ncbi:MAG: alpha/beta hydrolase family esterase [Nevskia sp.]|uniref:alpha/beta hydrolase family esterase n=1 Tax=Nevskia sp. TaxID=1929292 RepID=UPI004036C3BC